MELGIHGVNSFATHPPGHTARLARLAEELGYRKNSWSQTVAPMTDPSGQEGAFPDGLLLDHRPARGWGTRQFDPGTPGAEPASGVVSRYLIS
jgi:hypothetical protein